MLLALYDLDISVHHYDTTQNSSQINGKNDSPLRHHTKLTCHVMMIKCNTSLRQIPPFKQPYTIQKITHHHAQTKIINFNKISPLSQTDKHIIQIIFHII